MSRVLLLTLSASLVALLSGCGGGKTGNCAPSNCTGCCTPTGECAAGTENATCGIAGAACLSCAAVGHCDPGARLCVGGSPPDAGSGGGAGGGTGGGTATGDACGAAVPIALANGVGAANGNRAGSGDDATGTCGGSGQGDIVFTFTTATAGTLSIDVRPTDSAQRLVAYVRTTCATQATEVPGACVSAKSAGGAGTMLLRNLSAGTYFLWVDGATAATGPVDVSLSLTPDLGDLCTNPIPLGFKNGEANATGSTAGALNDSSSTCGGAGPDLVYRFDVSATANFDVTITPRNVNVQPVVSLRSNTCAGLSFGCNTAGASGGTAVLRIGSLPAGTYYLWVDSASSNAGDYELLAHLTAPLAGDTCSDPTPLVFSNGTAGGTAAAGGDTTSAFGDALGSCGAATGGDVVYSFTTNTVLDLRASLSTSSATYQPVLYLRGASCSAGERACGAATVAGGTAALAAGSLPAGTYYLWVDGAAASSGTYSLAATLAPPQAAEGCTTAKTLTFSNGGAGGTTSETGDTALAFPDTGGSCGGTTGADLVYTFTTTTLLNLRATVTPTGSAYQPVLYLRSGGCLGAERACSASTLAGGAATLTAGSLPAGTYSLWVDSASATAVGGFGLTASLDPPPIGDVCANPLPLTFSGGTDGGTASAAGDTALLTADTTGTCATGTSADEVYTFTTTTPLDFRVSATPTTSTYRPALYLRQSTCTGVEVSCNAAAFAGGAAALTVGSLPAGTWNLFVDGVAGTAGAYTLASSLAPPAPGEGCANAKPLAFTFGADGGTASDTGDLSLNFADSAGSCATGASPDVVYTFTTTSTRDFTASATTSTGTFRPALYLRDAACTGTERTCSAAALAGGTANLSVLGLPAGTYFLWVDGALGTSGAYALSASLLNAPADAVRAQPVATVTRPATMEVIFEVVDRFGNVMAGDGTTTFTVNATGAALFTGALQGTIVSGSGTASVVVRVQAGRVRLTVSDTTAQTVTFTAVDTQPNGLKYPGTTFTQTAPTVQTPCGLGTITSTFATGFTATGAGTVTVSSTGDLNGGTTEYLDVFMETVGATPFASIFTAGPGQCSTVPGIATVPVPLANLQTYLSDGSVAIILRATSGVTCGLCTGTANQSIVTLSFPMSITGTFL